jgi:RNA polymerase sigma-70 factor, ECF subfamily
MLISLASSRANGFLSWSKNHPNIAFVKPPETAGCSMEEFGKRFEAEIPRLRRYARALTRNRIAADDLVQDSLERGLAKRHLWRQETNLRAWLFTVMHNQFVNQVRRGVREGIAISVSDSDPSAIREADQGKRLELRDLDRALARLPEEQRSVVLLIGLEGMSYAAVAEVIGIPVGTVRSRLSRARTALRRLMDDLEPDNQTEAVVARVVTATRLNDPRRLAA